MKFGFIAKHRSIWPVAWLCEALGVSRSGFHAWLARGPSARALADEALAPKVRASFVVSARTYGARRVWRDVLADGVCCGLHKVERLMRAQGLRARPRRRALPKDEGERLVSTVAPNVLDRQFAAERPNQKWIADFTYVWTAEGWLYSRTGRHSPAPFASTRVNSILTSLRTSFVAHAANACGEAAPHSFTILTGENCRLPLACPVS